MNTAKISYTNSFKNLFPIYKQIHSRISTTSKNYKVVPKNSKLKKSSHDWLTRHLNDPYVKLAKVEMYRARSAFKLVEIDEQHKILKPGQIIVECGAAPGAWTQVIVSRINSLAKDESKPIGKALAIDKVQFAPVEGALILSGHDFTSDKTQKALLQILDGQKVDGVLSDMAPNACGTKSVDHEAIMELAYSALKFALLNSKKDAMFLCKIWEGHRAKQFRNDLEKYYDRIKIVKPNASRKESAELFYLARSFKGIS